MNEGISMKKKNSTIEVSGWQDLDSGLGLGEGWALTWVRYNILEFTLSWVLFN